MNNKFKLKLLFFIGIFVGTSLCAPRVYLSPNEQYGVFAEIRIAIENKQFERAHAKLNLLQRTSKGVIRSEMLKELQESLAAAEQLVTPCLGACAICQEDMTKDGKVEDGKDLIAAFECGHVLHRGCILAHGRVRWVTCPICRAPALREFQQVSVPVSVHAPVSVPVQDEFSVLVRPDDVPQTMWVRVIRRLRTTHGQELDLSNKRLTSQRLASIINALSQEIREHITCLNISDNRLTVLPDVISDLIHLKKLYANNNQLITLPEWIGRLNQLDELLVSDNQLQALPRSICSLIQLKTLCLGHNLLTELPELMGNLIWLERLDLSNNRLITLPNTLGNLAQLKFLNVENNKLTTPLPDTIGNLARLKKLYLSNNQLTELPETVGNLTQLEELCVSSNQLIALPDAVGNLTRLETLDAFDNKLTVLPELIGNLTQLEKLGVSNNKLTVLPKWIGNLTWLKYLHISGNQLTVLPNSIQRLTHLKIIFIDRSIDVPQLISRVTIMRSQHR